MLEPNVMHCFRKECDRVIKIMRHTIAVNGSLFYLLRMLVQYLHNAYRLGKPTCRSTEGLRGIESLKSH